MIVIFGLLWALVLVAVICSEVTPVIVNGSESVDGESGHSAYTNRSETRDLVNKGRNGKSMESKYPFLAAIGYKFPNRSRIVDYTRTVCSGFIIDHYRVLTTCSCFHYPNRPRKRAFPDEYVVSTGMSQESTEADMWNVDKLEFHPECNEDDAVRMSSNVAVVLIEQPGFTFDSRTQPANNWPLNVEKASEEFQKMASTSGKCAVFGWSFLTPMFVKLSASLIPAEQCVNPSCNEYLICRHSTPTQGMMIRMNGVQVNSTSLTTGAPLICNDTLWGIVDTAKFCLSNIFTLTSPEELLFAVENFTRVQNNTVLFSQIEHNSAKLSRIGSLERFFLLLAANLLRMFN
uniref:Kallikrein-1 n=1 Tax=Lygus hesperus TaxID=30085 RepID=A0A0A9YYK7_LYGHE